MKKVSELTGKDLDFWALMARNVSSGLSLEDAKNGASLAMIILGTKPTQSWSSGGDIIEREKISLKYNAHMAEFGQQWAASINSSRHNLSPRYAYGETPLIAAMRAYVASVYGEYVSE